MQDEKYLDARDLLRPVLAENPQQRDARRLQRLIEEKTAPPAFAAPRLRPVNAQPISLEQRDVAPYIYESVGEARRHVREAQSGLTEEDLEIASHGGTG